MELETINLLQIGSVLVGSNYCKHSYYSGCGCADDEGFFSKKQLIKYSWKGEIAYMNTNCKRTQN